MHFSHVTKGRKISLYCLFSQTQNWILNEVICYPAKKAAAKHLRTNCTRFVLCLGLFLCVEWKLFFPKLFVNIRLFVTIQLKSRGGSGSCIMLGWLANNIASDTAPACPLTRRSCVSLGTLGQDVSLCCPSALFCHWASLSSLITLRHFWHSPVGCWDTGWCQACFPFIPPKSTWQRGKYWHPYSLSIRHANLHCLVLDTGR